MQQLRFLHMKNSHIMLFFDCKHVTLINIFE